MKAEVFETAKLPPKARTAIFSPWVVRLPGGYLAGVSSEAGANQIADGYNEQYGDMTLEETERLILGEMQATLQASFKKLGIQ